MAHRLLAVLLLMPAASGCMAQSDNAASTAKPVEAAPDDALWQDEKNLPADSLERLLAAKQPEPVLAEPKRFVPDPKRALWLGIVLPGAGQIYNRKYWKLPIVYGGFVGCAYAMRWNNQMYRDYSQAYIDLMDDDPTTESYNQFLHLGAKIDDSNKRRYSELFRKRKDRYRRYRDLSFFALVGVYALSVIDAYVDASLSEFDISDDLSLRIEPAVINGATSVRQSPLKDNALGLSCSLNF